MGKRQSSEQTMECNKRAKLSETVTIDLDNLFDNHKNITKTQFKFSNHHVEQKLNHLK